MILVRLTGDVPARSMHVCSHLVNEIDVHVLDINNPPYLVEKLKMSIQHLCVFYPYITEALSARCPSALVQASLVYTIPVCAE